MLRTRALTPLHLFVSHAATPPAPFSLPACTQSPGWAVFPGRAYSFCIHMRVAPAAPATISSLFSLRKVPYGGAVAGCASGCGAQLKTVTQAWQQLCLSGITFSAPENVYFSVGLGSSVGALYMDDASLTYTVA